VARALLSWRWRRAASMRARQATRPGVDKCGWRGFFAGGSFTSSRAQRPALHHRTRGCAKRCNCAAEPRPALVLVRPRTHRLGRSILNAGGHAEVGTA